MPTATVLSICPFETTEIKPIIGGYYKVPAAPKDDFILLVINDSAYIQRLPATDHNITVPVPAYTIAKSIVDDFINTVIEATDDAGPGMMWFEGTVTRPEVTLKRKSDLEELIKRQLRWFENLCKKADDDWNQYRKSGLISDHQRYAARYLGYKPEWLIEYNQHSGMIDCPGCYSKIDSRAAVCMNCSAVIDRAKAIQLGIIPSDIKQLPAPNQPKG